MRHLLNQRRPRIRVRRRSMTVGTLTLAAAALLWTPLAGSAATTPALGRDTSFAVLAGSTITNTGPTSITGDLGLSPGTSVTGFPPGVVNGATHVADAVSVQAKSDLTTAYNTAAAQPCTSTLTGDLGGRRLTPGVYCYPSAAVLTGTLTLDGGGDPNALFLFKVGSTLTTATSSRVTLVNGGPCGVHWQVGSSATLGTDTVFVGTMLVNTSITLNTGASLLSGRVLAQTGAVTLDSNHITRPPDTCSVPTNSSTTSLTSSSSQSAPGQPVVLSTTVTSSGAGTPTGTVTFHDGSTVLGTAPLDSSGRATLTTTALTPGRHTITAVYSGSPGVLTSVSPPLVQTVSGGSTTSTLRPPQVGAAGDGALTGGVVLLLMGALLLLLSAGSGPGSLRRDRRGA
jgi:ice-binding like protein/Big-like domain-containing protein